MGIENGAVSIIGGGGKTTMAHVLCAELMNLKTVIFCTTTKIMPSSLLRNFYSPSESSLNEAIKKHKGVCIGKLLDNGKLCESDIPIKRLSQLADNVIIEADGSKGLPLKAHEQHEPIINPCSTKTILVVGIDGIGSPICKAAHRPELYSNLAGVEIDTIVTPEIAAKVINTEKLHDIVFINKISTDMDKSNADKLASLIKTPVFAGQLQKGEWYACNN